MADKWASTIIRLAKAELGYKEKASNADLDSKTANAGNKNFTKYARDLDNVSYFNTNKQGYEWCTIFVNWCFYKAFGKETAWATLYQPSTNKTNYGAGCIYAVKQYKAANRYFTLPRIGDQIFFGQDGDEDHTGIVIAYDDTTVTTIEGNSSNMVKMNTQKLKGDPVRRVAGFGRPNYDGGDPYVIHIVKKGDTLNSIAATYRTTAARIAQENNISNPNIIVNNDILIFRKNTLTEKKVIKPVNGSIFGLQCALGVSGTGAWNVATQKACKEVKKGTNGNLVRVLQYLLMLNGYKLPSGADGQFGNETLAAVKNFQFDHYLEETGVVDLKTWEKILDANGGIELNVQIAKA